MADDVSILIRLQNELSGPLKEINSGVTELLKLLGRLDNEADKATGGLDTLESGAIGAGDAVRGLFESVDESAEVLGELDEAARRAAAGEEELGDQTERTNQDLEKQEQQAKGNVRELTVLQRALGGLGRGFQAVRRFSAQAFSRITTQVAQLRQQIGPLVGRVTALAGAFLSFQGVSRAISLAERQVQLERSLLGLVGGRRDLLQRILDISSRLQQRTTFGDEEILLVTKRLLTANLSIDDLEETLLAVLNTAAGTSSGLEQVARGVQQFGQNAAGELGDLVPLIRDLRDQEILAAEGVNFLNEAFSGQAEALAQTDFGRAQQQTNALADTAEELGEIFITLKTQALAGLQEGLEEITGEKGKAALTAVVVQVGRVVRGVGRLLPQILAVVGAFTAAAIGVKLGLILITLGNIGIAIAAFLAPILAVGVAVGLIVFAIAELTGTTEQLLGFFKEIGDNATTVFKALVDGTLEFNDLWDTLQNVVSNFFLRFFGFVRSAGIFLNRFIIQPIKITFETALNVAKNLFKFVLTQIALIGLKLVRTIAIALSTVVRAVATVLDKITRTLDTAITKARNGAESISDGLAGALLKAGSAVGIIDATADQIDRANQRAERQTSGLRTNLAAGIPTGEDVFKGEIAALQKTAEQAGADLAAVFPKFRADANKNLTKGDKEFAANTARTNAEVAANDKATQDRIIKRRLARLAAEKAAKDKASGEDKARDKKTEDDENRLAQLRIARQQTLEQRIQSVVSDTNIEALKLRNEAELAALDNRLQRQLISEEEFVAERERLLKFGLAEQLQNQEDQTQAIRNKIEAIRDEEGADANVLFLLKLQLNEELKLQALEEKSAAIDRTIDADRLAAAERLVEGVKTQQAELENLIQTQQALADAGVISQVEAEERITESLERFKTAAQETQDRIATLLQNPQFTTDLIRLDEIIQKIKEDLKGTALAADDFFGGLQKGLKESLTEFDKLSDAGQVLGTTIGESLKTNIGSAFKDLATGAKSTKGIFKDLAASILSDLAAVLARIAITRALSAGFGFAVANAGGFVRGFAGGGPVPGPNVNRDIVPAVLTPGEYVQTRGAVQHYGVGVMEALRRKMIPKSVLAPFGSNLSTKTVGRRNFQEGGIAEGAGARQNGVTIASVIADDETLERLLNGGDNAFFRYIGDNAAQIRGQLGVGTANT